MNAKKKTALERAGFVEVPLEDFLGLSKEEMQLVELRAAVASAVRRHREQASMTQPELAAKIGSSQSRVAKLEAGASGVSLDLMFRGLFAVGGRIEDAIGLRPRRKPPRAKTRKR